MRKILLVIDMQNDFINGALGTPEAEAIVDRVAEEIGKYPAGDVIATRDTHPENYLETQEGRAGSIEGQIRQRQSRLDEIRAEIAALEGQIAAKQEEAAEAGRNAGSLAAEM